MVCPSTFTLTDFLPFSKSHAYRLPRVDRRRFTHRCSVRSCGVFGDVLPAKYSGEAATDIRMSGEIRTATMSLSMRSPTRTPASKRCAAMSVKP
ncbi:hypothetical protein D3C71_1325290 [compost metagenome]